MSRSRRSGRGKSRPYGNRPAPQCPLCHKPVRDVKTSVRHNVTNAPAHFDCIIAEIAKTEPLGPDEKLCYLGRGSFGILSFRDASRPLRFLIRKRIQYESAETRLETRDSRNQR